MGRCVKVMAVEEWKRSCSGWDDADATNTQKCSSSPLPYPCPPGFVRGTQTFWGVNIRQESQEVRNPFHGHPKPATVVSVSKCIVFRCRFSRDAASAACEAGQPAVMAALTLPVSPSVSSVITSLDDFQNILYLSD